MLYYPNDAEDVTQEILLKLTTKLSTFERRSSFRTWLYQIAVNHILNVKRRNFEDQLNFVEYGRGLDATPDMDLPDPNTVPVDLKLMVDEARIGCTSGMLLCLDREQRLIYILADIFGVSDRVGAELLNISRDNFRQKLSRARRDLHSFMQNKCGLVNTANPCRCSRKTQGFAKAGYLNPKPSTYRRPLRSLLREPSWTEWRMARRTSSPIPWQRLWRTAIAAVRPRRSSASMRRS